MPVFPDDPIYARVDEVFTYNNETCAFDANDRHRSYFRHYRIVSKTVLSGGIVACKAPTLPDKYSLYNFGDGTETDTLAILVRRTARREQQDDWQNWIVTDEYSTNARQPPDVPDINRAEDNPELEWPEVEWDEEETHHAPQMDLDGQAYLNSATQPFQPSPTVPNGRRTLHITRNELDFDPLEMEAFEYTINDNWFLGYEPGRVLLMPPRAKMVFRGILKYWRVSYVLKFHEIISTNPDCQFLMMVEQPDGSEQLTVINGEVFTDSIPPQPLPLNLWQPCILDSGLCQLDPIKDVPIPGPGGVIVGFIPNPTYGRPLPIWRGTGMVHHPVCLDGGGHESKKLNANRQPDPKGKIFPTYIVFNQYRESNFSILFDPLFRKPSI
jgi:hypothetical protein